MRALYKTCILLWCCLCLSACAPGDLIRNSMIERWCGERPCDWKVSGAVKRVGSWHPNDYAVELLSDDAQLSQQNATLSSAYTRCLAFSMIAKVERGTRVFLELDFLSDGTAEFSQRLPESDWRKLTFKITPPEWYQNVTFILRKDGPGKAILAELSAYDPDGSSYYYNGGTSCTAPPVELDDRPEGALCERDEQCAEATCRGGRCGGCGDDEDCREDEVCGRRFEQSKLVLLCLPRQSAGFGEICTSSPQCASGFCTSGVCSECEAESCGEGRACVSTVPTEPYWPWMCSPGSADREPGALCLAHSDCASGKCLGAERICPSQCEDDSCASLCADPQMTGGQCE